MTCKECETIYSLDNHKVCPHCKGVHAVPPLNATERNKSMKSAFSLNYGEAESITNKVESAVMVHGELDDLFGFKK